VVGQGPTLIQSVQRALRLVEIVAERDGRRAHAKELAREAQLPLGTTYHLLRTCAHEGWLQRLPDGSYVLGHRLDAVRAHGAAGRAVAQARPALQWLRDRLHGAAYLARYADGEIVVAEIVDSPRTPRIDLWVGMHDAAHATALGKSILGHLPPDERQDYLSRHPLHGLTPRTVVEPRLLRLPGPGELAVDEGEYAVGVCCLGAPVLTGTEVAAVAVVLPPSAVGREHVRDDLRAGAARVARTFALASVASI
jgi:DNA-binding IclR family transcriptional regulator